MISVREAKAIASQNCPKGSPIKVNLFNSVDLVNAKDIHSPIYVPSFDNSAMDGYAFAWSDRKAIKNASHTMAAGDQPNHELLQNTACRVFTGAPIPKGADTVIPQEMVTDREGVLSFDLEKISKGANVRRKGTQSVPGDKILAEGAIISPGTIGLLASLGIANIEVFGAPSVAVLVVGSELKEVGTTLYPGQIYNTNGPVIISYLKKLGIKVIEVFNIKDDPKSVLKAIDLATKKHDFTIISGGISVGDYDFVKKSLVESGVRKLFHKVKHRPGKPLYLGTKSARLIFGLPGNPAAVISCFLQYVKPMILQWMGFKNTWEPSTYLALEDSFSGKSQFTYFLKARRNEYSVSILPGQESFNLNSFGEANCMVEIPEGRLECQKGDRVAIYDW